MSKSYKRKLNSIVKRSIRKELDINKNIDINDYKRTIIDDVLDLHGYTKLEAHGIVLDFLDNAKENNFKIVRIITGKGEDEYSPLRNYIISLLKDTEFKYNFAPDKEGGEGAIDIKI